MNTLSANLFTADEYYKHSEGLNIRNNAREIVLIVKADSTNKVGTMARDILNILNADYYQFKAELEDNHWMYERGLITTAEYDAKNAEICNRPGKY